MDYEYYDENMKNFKKILKKLNDKKEKLEESEKDIVEHINSQLWIYKNQTDSERNDSEKIQEIKDSIKEEIDLCQKLKNN